MPFVSSVHLILVAEHGNDPPLTMAASNPKNMAPPKFNEDVDTWEDYKKELEMWQSCTSLEAKKQGPAFYLALKGKAKEIVKNIPNNEITADNGLNRMLTELNKLYEKDKEQNQYLTYKAFLEFRRTDEMTMKDYIAKFEVHSAKIKAKGFDMPESALAYHLLDFARLDDEAMKLTKATLTELKYDSMKERLLKIFGDEVVATSSGDAIGFDDVVVKQEPVFYGYNEYSRRGRGGRSSRGGRYRGRGRGQQRSVRQQSQERQSQDRQPSQERQRSSSRQPSQERSSSVNPPSKCGICKSIYHWSDTCPHKDESSRQPNDIGCTENENEEVILLQTKDYKKETLSPLVKETLGCGLVDSGCSKSVAGEQWLKSFEDSVDQNFEKCKSDQKFRFGKGDAVSSVGKVTLPIRLGDKEVKLQPPCRLYILIVLRPCNPSTCHLLNTIS